MSRLPSLGGRGQPVGTMGSRTLRRIAPCVPARAEMSGETFRRFSVLALAGCGFFFGAAAAAAAAAGCACKRCY